MSTARERGLLGSALIIGFEATSPSQGSWPIEVAVGWPISGEVRSWIIRPDDDWLRRWDWSLEAERRHGIRPSMLFDVGRPAHDVAREVLGAARNAVPYSDNPAAQQTWLRRLLFLLPAGIIPRVEPVQDLYDAITGGGATGAELVKVAEDWAAIRQPRLHRAAADVRNTLAVLTLLESLSTDLP
jgi:hypothetical protein